MSTALHLHEAVFGYGGHPVVGPVDLRVEAGESVALTGPNGSGKTTLMTGLLGLSDHLAGTVEVFDRPLASQQDRLRVGWVPQHHTVSDRLHATVGEVVMAGRVGLLPWWRRPGAADHEAVARVVDEVGLTDRLRDSLTTLSGGQKRRALLARALVTEPRLVVLDEPIAGVDIANQRLLASLLKGLSERGLTMLVITHEFEPLRGVIDRVVTLNAGRITEDRRA